MQIIFFRTFQVPPTLWEHPMMPLSRLVPLRPTALMHVTCSPTPTHPPERLGPFIFGVLTVHNDVPGISILLSFFPGGLTPQYFMSYSIQMGCLGHVYNSFPIPSLLCEYWILHFLSSKYFLFLVYSLLSESSSNIPQAHQWS